MSKYEEGHVVLSSLPDSVDAMATRLLDSTRPLVGERTKGNQVTLFNRRPLLVVYFDVSWERELKKGTSEHRVKTGLLN